MVVLSRGDVDIATLSKACRSCLSLSQMHVRYLLFRQSVSVGWLILAWADRHLGLRNSFFTDFERLSVFSKLPFVVVLSRSHIDITTLSETCWPRWR